jgi:hypothetical protein
MSLMSFRRKRALYLMPLVAALTFQRPALADDCCEPKCSCFHCPPPLKHCMEGPPKICFKHGCPKPVCTPDCSTPNWGYFQPCWRPWPWPPDYSHCPGPTPAAFAGPCGPGCTVPGISNVPVGEPLPPPRPVDRNVRQSL